MGRVLSCHCGGGWRALGSEWGWGTGGGDRRRGDPPWPQSPAILRDPGGLRAQSHRTGSAAPLPPPCWVCILSPLPFPSLGGGRAGGPASGRAGPACDPLRFSRERERAWLLALRGHSPLRKHIRRWGPWGRKQLQAAGSGGARGEEGRQTPQLTQFVVGALCSTPPRVRRALPVLSRAQEVKLADSVLRVVLLVFILRLRGQGLGWQLGRGDQQSTQGPSPLARPEQGNQRSCLRPPVPQPAAMLSLLEALGGCQPPAWLWRPLSLLPAGTPTQGPPFAQAGPAPLCPASQPSTLLMKKSQII